MQHTLISINELRYTFFSLKLNKTLGYGDISLNIIYKFLIELFEPLRHVFNLSIESGVFSVKLKIARVSQGCK